ncbi:hypothetical protein FVD15_00615 [Campylobacter volucris]|uniref:Uncharacterized protein n=1 Tax=Campylobacter volucris TaxID=1031542 RepID=A0AAE5YH75_9BACT|nr:hypothetical protein [Campylobacter volucris]AJC94505.1 hypothetical protein CVOL_1204 [Campylobacter volucris LMG 24379]KAB0578051.1 hypothetical protein F7P61_07300 [Campylobacter volucris]QBL13142.1 hypothetical protein A9460_01890 [Campylobacter volucris]QEL08721.1 hypothetical protein CVOLT_1210 [Campylobacter volucris]TXK71375.1 hypothetical protein FVD15_00615 [Campylobacter volucris]
MTYKKFVFLSILIPLPIIFTLGILLYVYDPLRLYHKPWFRDDTYYSDIRLQAKSIIDNNDFDSVIIGSSMLENTSAKEASEKLNANFINLSIAASTFSERFIVLKYLIDKKNLKNIIYSLDGFTLVNGDKIQPNIKRFHFLYDKNKFNDFKIYLNKHFILCAITFSQEEQCVGKNIKVDYLLRWKKDKNTLSTLLLNNKNNIFFETTSFLKKCNYTNNTQYISNFLLKMFQQTNINFHLIIPTQPRIFYKLKKYRDYFDSSVENYFFSFYKNIQFIVQQSQYYPNVKIYGFDDLDYADDIANYKDLVHYNIDMNSMQLDAIKNNTHILTTENIDEYFKIMEEKIISYDLQPIIEKINKNK